MIQKENKFFDISEKLNRNFTYILGVSGGPDSMFLLDFLRSQNFKIVIAHVNYKKREDSDLDEEMVRSYCSKNSLIFEVTYPLKEERIVGNFQN
jgi:tRNA(Ile)-lysidine synthase